MAVVVETTVKASFASSAPMTGVTPQGLRRIDTTRGPEDADVAVAGRAAGVGRRSPLAMAGGSLAAATGGAPGSSTGSAGRAAPRAAGAAAGAERPARGRGPRAGAPEELDGQRLDDVLHGLLERERLLLAAPPDNAAEVDAFLGEAASCRKPRRNEVPMHAELELVAAPAPAKREAVDAREEAGSARLDELMQELMAMDGG